MRRPLLAACAVVAVALAGCSGGDETSRPSATTAASDTTTPSPSPTWELQPVVGERVPGVFPLSSSEVLGFGGAEPVDEQSVDRALEAVGEWLDAHLDALQRAGGRGRLGQVADKPFLSSFSTDELALITTALASPEAPVESARYHLGAYQDGPVAWVSATVDVMHPEGPPSNATMVFTFGDTADDPVLTMAGPETAVAQ